MKWYMEFFILWIIVFFVYFLLFTSSNDPIGLRLMQSLVIGTILSAAGYAGYKDIKKKQQNQEAMKVKKENDN